MRLTYQERVQIKAEKEAEKKRIREEKKKEKERLKKIERHKKSRQKSNKKYYAKIRAKQLAERKKEGDEKGSYLILLVKDKKRYDKLGEYRWKNAAFKAYNEAGDLFKTDGWKDHVYKISYTDSRSRNLDLWKKNKTIILDPDNKVGTLHKHEYAIYDNNDNSTPLLINLKFK